MNLMLWIYLTNILGNLSSFISVFFILSLGVTLIFCLVYAFSFDAGNEEVNESSKTILTTLIKKWWFYAILIIMKILAPSEQSMYLMLGAKYLQSSDVPAKVSEILNLKLDDVLKQLKDEQK